MNAPALDLRRAQLADIRRRRERGRESPDDAEIARAALAER